MPTGHEMTVVAPIDTRRCRKIHTAQREILPNELAVLNQRAKQQSHRRRMRLKHVDLPLRVASMRRWSDTQPNTKYSMRRSRAEDFEGCLLQSSCRKSKRQELSSPLTSGTASTNQSLGRIIAKPETRLRLESRCVGQSW